MYDREISDMEELEGFDHETLDELDGEGVWNGEDAAATRDLETFELGEVGFDHEDEADQFIGSLLRKGVRTIGRVAKRRGVGLPFLKNLAKQAATVAGGAIAGRTGANIAGQVANQVLRESEYEYDGEIDGENEYEALGGDPEILEEMNYLAAMASETDNEDEADQFIGAIASLAGPLLKNVLGGVLGGGDDEAEGDPFIGDILGGLLGESDLEDLEGNDPERDEFLPLLAGALPMLAPLVGKGVKAIGKLFRGGRRTRPAIRALPRIAANSAAALARQARRGRRITARQVASTVARQATRELGNPQRLGQAMRQNRVSAARAQVRPAGIAPRTGRYAGPRRRGYAAPQQRGRLVGYIPVYATRRPY